MTTPTNRIAVFCEDAGELARAEALAARLDLPLAGTACDYGFLLVVTGQRLELRQTGSRAPGPVFVDFTSAALAYRRKFGGGRKEPLARAVGMRHNRAPYVVDATAGLGRDSFVLAALGCRVLLFERSPLVAALLDDGLERGRAQPSLAPIMARMELRWGDSTRLDRLRPVPDVIYLDPMYPHRRKSALVKKEMRLLRSLVGDDEDTSFLLDWALSRGAGRVVVKRPKTAPSLADKSPQSVIRSGNSRFDIYFP